MASILHGSARTTPRIRAELQASQEKASVLAKRYGLSRTTVNKWRSRSGTADAPMGPKERRSTVLTPVEEAMIVAFRQRTMLPLDDVMGCLRDQIAKLTRSSLHRCLERHGISRLPVDETMAKRGRTCAEHDIKHKLTKSYHPWTNGQAERMNRTIKDATIKVFHYPDLESLKAHVIAFVRTYNFAKHLKALRWKTPFEAISHEWIKHPAIFKIDPRHLIPGPNI